MNTLDRIVRDYEASAATLPPGALAQRGAAFERLRQWGLPSTRDESWRYANLRALDAVDDFRPAALAAPPALPPPLEGFQRLVFVNGRRAEAPPAEAVPEWDRPEPELRLGLLTDMFATDRAALRVRGEAAIELLFVSTAAGAGAVYPQLTVELEAGSRLNLVERHLGSPRAPGLVCANGRIRLRRGAQLTHHRLQQCEPATMFSDTLAATLEENARYEVAHIAVGAGSSRSSASISLDGRGASFAWRGIAVGQGEQVHDALIKVQHNAPGTRTDELFRAIGADRARLACNAQIEIQAGAPGSQVQQSLRGLVDGPGAEIDLRPGLRIHTDEVQARHGATSGQLDENLLFYLLSRGLDRASARALLKWAFLGEVLAHIQVPALRQAAEQAAAGQLSGVLGALP